MINFSGLLAVIGVFIVPLTAVLGVVLWNIGSFIFALATGQEDDYQQFETLLRKLSTLAQVVGMAATLSGLSAGLSQLDLSNPQSFLFCMGHAFWATYFAVCVAGLCLVFVVGAPFLHKFRMQAKPAPAARAKEAL